MLFVDKEALAVARAAFETAYAEAQTVIADANLQVTKEKLTLQANDATAAYYLWSNKPEANEGDINSLFDGSVGVKGGKYDFFHTNWSDGNNQARYHYIEVDLGEGNAIDEFEFGYNTRNNDGVDFPDAIQVMGSNEKGGEYTEIYNVSSGLPQGAALRWNSPSISSETAYRYIRFNVDAERTYWHMSEFDMHKIAVVIAEKYATVKDAVLVLNAACEAHSNNTAYTAEQLSTATEAINAAIEVVNAGVATPELEALEATKATRNPAESDWDPSKSYYLQGVKLDFAEAVKKADGVTEFGCIYDANGEVVAVINKILGANGTAKYATPYVATQITTAGTYKVVVYPGVILSADGAKEYKGGEFEFVVAKKPATLIPSAEDGLFYNASFTSVEEFKTQQIIVSGADEVTVSEEVKITMTSGENVYTATVTVEDKDGNKVINIVFPDEDYAAGRYTINIPEGAFLVDGVANAEYYASNFTYNKPQLKVTKDWTSWEALFTEKYMMPREVIIAINNADAVTVAEGMAATLAVGETTYNSTVSFTNEENNYWISFKFAEIEAIYENEDADFVKGEYTFTVPAGLYTVNGEANVEETRVFTYGDAVVEEFSVTSVSPAVGDVTELNRIEIAFSNNTKPEQLILTNGDERFFFIAKDGAYVAVDPLKDYAEITITELGTYTLDLSELDGLTGDKVFSWTVVEPTYEVNYTPAYTGTKENLNRNVIAVTLGNNRYDLTSLEQSSCYVDATAVATFKVEAGATVKATVERRGEWMHHAVYIDVDGDGFTSGIEEGSNWKPAGDLVAYSFYNNGDSSDEFGYNSVGTSMSDMDRHMPEIPEFVAPAAPGIYRMRFVQDWCSIDPNGDSDGKFGDFMANGGQIVDVMLEVVEAITDGIDDINADAENAVIYDLTGRKIEKVTKAGIYIINGVKKVVK